MNTTQPLNNILFLLDEISQAKNRINIATHTTRDIEIALLQSKIVALYGEIQHYNHQAMQPSAAQQVPVNHYQAAPKQESVKGSAVNASSQKEPWPFDTPALNAENTSPLTGKKELVAEPSKAIIEASQPTEKQPKPEEQRPEVESKSVEPQTAQPQTLRKDVTDFEKKREKLLREEEEEFNTPKPAVNEPYVAPQVQETKQPEPVQQPQVIEQKPEPAKQVVAQPQPEIQKPVSQPAPEPTKPNVSQLYAQARERAAGTTGTEKSLNEKLATQQTSLNDKFQSNVKKNLADKLKLSPISDLRTAININQRVAFINQLFKGDDKEFKNVVSTVNGFKNFSEAKFFVQSEVAPRYSWNEEDPAVQEFMELVYRKFL
jgi:hypothetical protein